MRQKNAPRPQKEIQYSNISHNDAYLVLRLGADHPNPPRRRASDMPEEKKDKETKEKYNKEFLAKGHSPLPLCPLPKTKK